MRRSRVICFQSSVILLVVLTQLVARPAYAAFTPISSPTTAYTGSTTLLPITVPDFTNITSVTNGTETVTFSIPMQARTVPTSWQTWNCPPYTESCTPRVLETTPATSVTIALSNPASTFGVEVEPDPYSVYTITATFLNGTTVLGTVSQAVNGYHGALLAAASDNEPITSVQISSGSDFAIAQIRTAKAIPVIVLPGVMGTSLNLLGQYLWVDPVLAIPDPFDSYLFALELDKNGNSVPGISTGPIFDGTVPVLFSSNLDFYSGLLNHLRGTGYQTGQTLFTFPYDWRLDNATNAVRLQTLIDQVLQQTGAPNVNIIAHSMGGLIVRRYLADTGGSKIGKVIYLGTPQKGAPFAFSELAFNSGPLLEDLPFINNSTLATVARTLPSVFQMLPSDQFIFSVSLQRDLTLDESYQLLLSTAWVNDAVTFQQSIALSSLTPQFAIVGTGLATLQQLDLLPPEPPTTSVSTPPSTLSPWMAESGTGDGTVPLNSGQFLGTVFYVNGIAHNKLPNATSVQQMIDKILQGNVSTLPPGVSTTPSSLPTTIEWTTGSPIKVTVTDSQLEADGVTTDGSVQELIPFSKFFQFTNNEGGFLALGQDYTFNIAATTTGVFSLSLKERTGGGGSAFPIVTFTNIPVGPLSRATFKVLASGTPLALDLDINGDGITDVSIVPGQPEAPGLWLDLLRLVVISLELDTGTGQSLLAKIDVAQKAVTAGRSQEAQNALGALTNEIQAQSGKHLSITQAQGLTSIIGAISGMI